MQDSFVLRSVQYECTEMLWKIWLSDYSSTKMYPHGHWLAFMRDQWPNLHHSLCERLWKFGQNLTLTDTIALKPGAWGIPHKPLPVLLNGYVKGVTHIWVVKVSHTQNLHQQPHPQRNTISLDWGIKLMSQSDYVKIKMSAPVEWALHQYGRCSWYALLLCQNHCTQWRLP